MVWREPKSHFNDCYFCLVDLKDRRLTVKKYLCLNLVIYVNYP